MRKYTQDVLPRLWWEALLGIQSYLQTWTFLLAAYVREVYAVKQKAAESASVRIKGYGEVVELGLLILKECCGYHTDLVRFWLGPPKKYHMAFLPSSFTLSKGWRFCVRVPAFQILKLQNQSLRAIIWSRESRLYREFPGWRFPVQLTREAW